MNTLKGGAKFKKFRILLDSGCSSTILMGRLIEKLTPKEDAVIQWHNQAGSITTNLKVNMDFTLPGHSATKTVIWNFHVDNLDKGRYDIILGRDILIYLGLNFKLSDHIIEAYYGTLKGYTTPMVDMGAYESKDLNTGKIKTE